MNPCTSRLICLGAWAILSCPVHPLGGDASPESGGAILTADESVHRPTAASSPEARISRLEALTGSADSAAGDWVGLGDALMQRSRGSLNPRDRAQAEKAYFQALTREPKNVQALVGLAWVHNTDHEFEEGRRFAEQALAIERDLPEAHALLGDAAVEYGDYQRAFDHYQTALDLRPDLSSYSRSAHLVWLTGDAVKARWLMGKAIKAGAPYSESQAWCLAELALMSFHVGALVPAEQQARLALKAAPDSPHALCVMGRIQMAKNEYGLAIDFYTRSVAIAPLHEALVSLGDLHVLTGKPEEAEVYFRRVVELHGSNTGHSHGAGPKAHSNAHGNPQLARFYADHDRELEQALREAKASHAQYPNISNTDTLAWCFYKLGQYREAEETLGQALRWKTPDAEILFHAGMIYSKLGNRQLAQEYLYQALSLNPNFHPTFPKLAEDTIKVLATVGAQGVSPPKD